MAEDTKDFFQQISEAAEESVPHILERLRAAAQGGGVRTHRFKCAHCGQMNSQDVEVMDVEEQRKLLESLASIQLRANAARKDDDASAQVRNRLRAIRDMTDEEIAEELIALERDASV